MTTMSRNFIFPTIVTEKAKSPETNILVGTDMYEIKFVKESSSFLSYERTNLPPYFHLIYKQ